VEPAVYGQRLRQQIVAIKTFCSLELELLSPTTGALSELQQLILYLKCLALVIAVAFVLNTLGC